MLIYVSGPYSGDIDANIAAAEKVAIDLWEMGHTALCPHLNTAHFEKKCKATYEQYIAGDLRMVEGMDAMVMVAGWETSKGANTEKDYAETLGIPIFYAPDYPPLTAQSRRETLRASLEHINEYAGYCAQQTKLGEGKTHFEHLQALAANGLKGA